VSDVTRKQEEEQEEQEDHLTLGELHFLLVWRKKKELCFRNNETF